MTRRSRVYVCATVVTLMVLFTAFQFTVEIKTVAQSIQAGVYEVDAMWPKRLPNRWVFGSVVGLSVDSRDHVWVVHRGKASMDPDLGAMMVYPPAAPRFGGGVRPNAGAISAHCCIKAPPVLEFDPKGNDYGSVG